ncbi:hypothetical protein F2Q69_00007238 [Brassica cretica]|uniref:Uncharacterized protein n=1 Tax=Brassica cretica TaxID=69181 RepID=A0A8S9PRC9_BRACR|nr:hypothetical protein F2Q69_00007238 [Brassica cretica]
MDSYRIDVLGKFGRYVATELGLCVVRWPYLSLSVADLDTCPLPSDNRYLVVRLRFEQDFTARVCVGRCWSLFVDHQTCSMVSYELKNGDIPIFPIFVIIFGNFTFIRGNLTFILPYEPSINRHKAFGFSVKKSLVAIRVRARSLRSDRAWLVCGPMAILEPVRGRFGYVSVAFGQSVFSGSIEIRTRFYRKALRKDFFMKITFRKNVHADFYGLSDIDSVVTDFDPNNIQ